MNKEQILHKAIDKAIMNGWSSTTAAKVYPKATSCGNARSHAAIDRHMRNYHALIFSQDFAKALWGEKNEPTCDGDCVHCGQGMDLGAFWKILPCWQYALQRMVLEDDPLRYLERFLEPSSPITM